MTSRSRRAFLADVGRGMLVSSIGAATAAELGLASIEAGDETKRVTFGPMEGLVSLMQETPPEKLLPILVEKLNAGVSLNTLVSAGALANVRAFAGQDYTGYHTFMALVPAIQMANQLPSDQRALPVLKVLYRNSSRIHSEGASHRDALPPVASTPAAREPVSAGELRDSIRAVNWSEAEAQFTDIATLPAGEAFNHLQYAVQDEVDVHRVVLSWRALAMLDVAGEEYAHPLLRQSVRYCLDVEQRMQERGHARSPIRRLLPKLMDEYGLIAKPVGTRDGDEAWVEELASIIFEGSREAAAAAVAAALTEGFHPESVGEAISIAANRLVLHDPGRAEHRSSKEKPPGCVHGDSVGVHASDAANAWRNISRVGDARNRISSLIVGAYHTAGQSGRVTKQPYPYRELIDGVRETEQGSLLAAAEEAIKANDQARACAIAQRYGDLELPVRGLMNLLLKYAVSEDGALHAEKYYQTVSEEYAASRPAFRWNQVVALARVTASEYGYPAPGYDEARELLRV